MEITEQVIDDFREFYPEFMAPGETGAQVTYSDDYLRHFLCEADAETGRRWGQYDDGSCSLKKRGMFAYAAHKASLSRVAARATAAGGVASAPAQVQSRSVADESINYAVAAPSSEGAAAGIGDFRVTIYGQEFLRLRRRAGMGPVVV